MRFTTLVASLASAGAAMGAVITVQVGANDTLTYSPSSVNASVGDTIMFEFVAKNHTVTESTFADPCTSMLAANGSAMVDSGFMPVAANATTFPTFSFTVQNTSAPLWFYCRQTGHCAMGMVFAVNPTAAKSFQAFQAAAKATGSNTTNTTSTQSTGASGTSTGTAASTSSTSTTSGAGAIRVGGAALALSMVGLVAGLL